MTHRPWNGLFLCLAVITLLPMATATHSARTAEPWPTLLAETGDIVDPSVAALQERATQSLTQVLLMAELAELAE